MHVDTANSLLFENTKPSRHTKVKTDFEPQFFDSCECLHLKSTNLRLFAFRNFLVTNGLKPQPLGKKNDVLIGTFVLYIGLSTFKTNSFGFFVGTFTSETF